jgi:hypothetical protein
MRDSFGKDFEHLSKPRGYYLEPAAAQSFMFIPFLVLLLPAGVFSQFDFACLDFAAIL